MITMLKLILPLKKNTITTVSYDCEKINAIIQKKIPKKKDAKKPITHRKTNKKI